MKKSILLSVLLVFLFAFLASAQMVDKAELGTTSGDYLGLKPALKPFSLIDLSKFKWSQSYSLSFFSGGGSSGSVGLYTGSLLYEMSRSLSMNFVLGIAHNPGSLFDRTQSTNAAFFPGFNLDFHPSNSFHLSVGVQAIPGNYYYYNPYSPYGYYYPWR
ncbi:conserved exported hypothetical protein [Candidatus Zixiibacteriota bacterium]|nr:conserved exported hypothetical protein [candidate division Zixibacteria bacterium]